MTEREPSRERFLQRRCEHCGRAIIEGVYMEHHDEYWCESCADNAAEAAWNRHQQDLMENGPRPTLAEQQAEARKLK